MDHVSADRAHEILFRSWQAETPFTEAMTAGTATAKHAVEVYGNHGRWIVECPDCLGAQIANKDDLRFMCHCCANAAIGGKWRPVKWPKDHAAIEDLLMKRPPVHRHFSPGETVKSLASENKERGL